jgi:hypothetical protein
MAVSLGSMKIPKLARLFCASLVVSIFVTPTSGIAAQNLLVTGGSNSVSNLSSSPAKELVRKARQSYYNLQTEGFSELRFRVVPDWDSSFKGLRFDDVGRDQVLPILKKAQFTVVIGPSGASTVSHQLDVAPPNEEVARRINTSIGGFEQVVRGFLQTWSSFAVGPPLPPVESDYLLQDNGRELQISYKEGNADISISMTREFEITEMHVASPSFTGNIFPTLTQTTRGYQLTGYTGNYTAGSGPPAEVAVSIKSSPVEGLDLPEAVKFTVTPANGAVITIQFTFTDRQVTKR